MGSTQQWQAGAVPAGGVGSRVELTSPDHLRWVARSGERLRSVPVRRVVTGRVLGLATRGTTNPNRLRRVDRWIVGTQAARLRGVRPDVRVVGLEIDPDRVRAAASFADPPGLDFARGGFELAGRRPVLVRALNVLRQYDPDTVADAWRSMRAALAPGGLVVEGTCDEIGRRACWVALDASGPLTLTLAARVASLEAPSDLAERLPKVLIHRNVRGEPVNELLRAFDRAWAAASPLSSFGPRQRWVGAVQRLVDDGWPVVGGRSRWRLGEITLRWSAVS